MRLRPYSATALALGGAILVILGLYFLFLRPPLLPEALVGLTSIGWMAAVNFIIGSDFKWLLLSFAFPWILALLLYHLEWSNKHCACPLHAKPHDERLP